MGVPAGQSAPGAAARYLTSAGARNAEARARLADGAERAHRATDIVGTMGVGGNTRAAVCFGAPTSPQEPLLMVIISVVSCRVQETVRLFLALPGTACPAARRPRSTEPAVPGYGGNARWTRRIGPDSCAWPWTNPGRNSALPKEIRTGAISSQASDLRQRGSTAGLQQRGQHTRGQTSVPVRGEYPSRRSPCGRLGWPGAPGTGRIPPKGPRRAQHYRRQSVAYAGIKLLSVYGRCQEGYHPRLPGIYSQDV
jgi:hypothetical protein